MLSNLPKISGQYQHRKLVLCALNYYYQVLRFKNKIQKIFPLGLVICKMELQEGQNDKSSSSQTDLLTPSDLTRVCKGRIYKPHRGPEY